MTAEGTMASRFLSEFMDTTHKYTVPPSRIDIKRVKAKTPFAHRPVRKVSPENSLSAEAPVTILKPFLLVGDLKIDDTSSATERISTKPKKSAKAKVVGFLTRPLKTLKPAYDRRHTTAPISKSTLVPAVPKPTPHTPTGIYAIDFVAGARRRADEAWAKAEKHSSIHGIREFFDSSTSGGSCTPFPVSSSSGFYTSASSSSISSREQSSIPSPVGTPSPSPRSYTPTRRSLYPFSRPSSPLSSSSPAFSSILVNEESNILSKPSIIFPNSPESKVSDTGRDSAKQDDKMSEIDTVANVSLNETNCTLLDEQESAKTDLSRATETIQDLMALVQCQALALEAQNAEIRDQQQLLSALTNRMVELEARPISWVKAPSLAPCPPVYDAKAIIKNIVNEIAANATPEISPPAARYLDKDALKDLIKDAATELFASVSAPCPPPTPPPPPPPAPPSCTSKAVKKTVVAKKSMIPRAGAQANPKFLEELTATIKCFNVSPGSSIPRSRTTSPAISNASWSSPRCLSRIPLRNRAGSPSDSDRSSCSSSGVSSAASPTWSRSSLRPPRTVLIHADVPLDPTRKFMTKSSSATRTPSSSTVRQNPVNWGRRVNATIPALSESPRDKRLAAELASIKARRLVAGKLT